MFVDFLPFLSYVARATVTGAQSVASRQTDIQVSCFNLAAAAAAVAATSAAATTSLLLGPGALLPSPQSPTVVDSSA